MSFKNKIRKIVGNCYNQVTIVDQALIRHFENDASSGYTNLFRVASNWIHCREEYLMLMNATLSAADIAANRHLWLQGVCRERLEIHNPTNYRVKFELYKITLKKCQKDYGYTAGTYVSPTLPFASGSANTANNSPADPQKYWAIWDQSSRDAGAGALTALNQDTILAGNFGGVYNAPAATNGWELNNFTTATTPAYLGNSTPLSFIFPELRKKCSIRKVAGGLLGPKQHRVKWVSHKTPREIRPRDIVANTYQNFRGGETFFYFVRAYVPKEAGIIPLVIQSAGTLHEAAGSYQGSDTWGDAQLVIYSKRKYGIRAGSDSLPSFQWARLKSVLGNTFGFIDTGTAFNGGQGSFFQRATPRITQHPVMMSNGYATGSAAMGASHALA